MRVLYNGEYTEFDITTNPNWEDLLAKQEKFYPQWEGKVYKDFEIVKIEWDWYLSRQRALLRCVHCGFEKYTNNPREFRRGKGAGQKCECQKTKKIEKTKKEVINYNDFVGEERNGFVSFEYVPNKGMRVCCLKCMNEKWTSGKSFLSGKVFCSHRNQTEYEENLLGKQFGALTVIDQKGGVCLCRCKCGFEKKIQRYQLNNGSVKTCGRAQCEFHKNILDSTESAKHRIEGLEFEYKLQNIFKQAGYEVIRTPDSGDYGVDFIVIIKGEKWAFQCKNSKFPASTHAVLEAYAGGRFYDCTRFCVASPSGFTRNAMMCAAKLGVQLETDRFRFNTLPPDNAKKLLETSSLIKAGGPKEKVWVINGVCKPRSEWCKEHNTTIKAVQYKMSKGMSLQEALTYTKPRMEINGEEKTIIEWCEEYGISKQLYDYRTKNGKMTPYEALTSPVRGKG